MPTTECVKDATCLECEGSGYSYGVCPSCGGGGKRLCYCEACESDLPCQCPDEARDWDREPEPCEEYSWGAARCHCIRCGHAVECHDAARRAREEAP